MVARNRVTLNGTMGNSETWSISLHYATPEGAVLAGPQSLNDWADAITADWFDLTNNQLGTFMSNQGRLTRVDTYQYGATGPAVAVGSSSLAQPSYSGEVRLPWQTCVVMSLKTALAGASFRGRAYWPAPGGTMQSDGTFLGFDSATAPGPRFAQLLEFIGAAAGESVGLVPHVYSPTRNLITPVIAVETDTVPDTQRRRADAIVGIRRRVNLPT